MGMWFGVIVGCRLKFHDDGAAFVSSADSQAWLLTKAFSQVHEYTLSSVVSPSNRELITVWEKILSGCVLLGYHEGVSGAAGAVL